MQSEIFNDYHDWITGLANSLLDLYSYDKHFFNLVEKLYSTEFVWEISQDENRASDGIEFRLKFAEFNPKYSVNDVKLYLMDIPCSILEMMLALSYRCEEDIMGDEEIGDRTGKWLYQMIKNLGLLGMNDIWYSEDFTNEVINNFLTHQYDYDGCGGLFHIENSPYDLRNMEIWYQMNLYLSEKFTK